MLPAFRAASGQVAGVTFGTVDCAMHSVFCSQQGIGSYPTLLLLNGSAPSRQYSGNPTAEELAQFIEEVRSPSVVVLDPQTFDRVVLQGAN
jgi:hypothetical protein